MTSRLALAGLLTLALTACGATPQGLQGNVNRGAVTSTQASQQLQLVSEGDEAFAKRADRSQLEVAIQKWEAAVQLKDDDYQTYAKLARGYYVLADGHLAFEPSQKKAYLDAHLKGLGAAERGMAALSPDFEKRRRAQTKLEDAVKVLDRNAVPLMYWYAANLGKWAKASSFSTVLKNKDRIFKVVSRVWELDRDFYYGAADRYFGAFYAIAPTFAGGDLGKSYEHFQESLKRDPKYLATYVLIAENYAPKMQDPSIFDEHLKFVLDAPLDIIPGMEAETAIEKRKAQILLEKKDDLF